jgi:hypothetical protein
MISTDTTSINFQEEIVMDKMNNSKGTPSKDTGSKNKNSGSITDYKYSPKVENPNPKAATDKTPSSGNIRGV